MKILLRLYSMTETACDGSRIPRQATEEYLRSEDYATRMRNHTSFMGVTHADRSTASEFKTKIGPDDGALLNCNTVGYISRIFTEPNNDFCMAEVTMFNPEFFSGVQKDRINYVIGMLRSGVLPPTSVVIKASWNRQEVAERIVGIIGVDITLNPSFKGSGVAEIIEKTFSETSSKISSKTFSATIAKMYGSDDLSYEEESEDDYNYNHSQSIDADRLKNQIKQEIIDECKQDIVDRVTAKLKEDLSEKTIASLKDEDLAPSPDLDPVDRRSLEVEAVDKLDDQRTYSADELFKTFSKAGLVGDIVRSSSDQLHTGKELKDLYHAKLATIPQEEIVHVQIGENEPLSYYDIELNQILESMQLEDPAVHQIIATLPWVKTNRLYNALHMPADAPNRKECIKDAILAAMRAQGELKVYSTIDSVNSRMRYTNWPRQMVLLRVIWTYKTYFESHHGEKWDAKNRNQFIDLIVNDLNIFLRRYQNEIVKAGKTMSFKNFYCLDALGDVKVNMQSDALFRTLYKANVSMKGLGYYPPKVLQSLKKSISNLYSAIVSYIFSGDVTVEDIAYGF